MTNIINSKYPKIQMGINGEVTNNGIAKEDLTAFDLVESRERERLEFSQYVDSRCTSSTVAQYVFSEDGNMFLQAGPYIRALYFHYRKKGETEFILLPESEFTSLFPFDTSTPYEITGAAIVNNKDIYISVYGTEYSYDYPANYIGIMKFEFDIDTQVVTYIGNVTNLNSEGTTNPNKIRSLALHPSKKFLVASVNRNGYGGWAIIDIESKVPNVINLNIGSTSADGDYQNTCFSPNGKYYIGATHQMVTIWKMIEDEHKMERLFTESTSIYASYASDDLSVSSDNKYVLYKTMPAGSNDPNIKVGLIDISDETSINASVDIKDQLISFTNYCNVFFDHHDSRILYARRSGGMNTYRLNDDLTLTKIDSMFDGINCLKFWRDPTDEYILARNSTAISITSVSLYNIYDVLELHKLQIPVLEPKTIGYVRRSCEAGDEVSFKEILSVKLLE